MPELTPTDIDTIEERADTWVVVFDSNGLRKINLANFPGAIETSTTTELEDVGDAINTTGKYVGKPVFNTTTGVLLVADTAAAAGTWSTAAGAATHSPV